MFWLLLQSKVLFYNKHYYEDVMRSLLWLIFIFIWILKHITLWMQDPTLPAVLGLCEWLCPAHSLRSSGPGLLGLSVPERPGEPSSASENSTNPKTVGNWWVLRLGEVTRVESDLGFATFTPFIPQCDWWSNSESHFGFVRTASILQSGCVCSRSRARVPASEGPGLWCFRQVCGAVPLL